MADMKPRQEKVPSSPLTSVDSSFLKTLVGYNTRRATLKILSVFTERMDALALKPVEFSILSLIGRNPGLTPSQLCAELGLLPPNLTKMLARLDQRDLVEREQKYRLLAENSSDVVALVDLHGQVDWVSASLSSAWAVPVTKWAMASRVRIM